jgi:hypothetical protein
VRERRVPKEVKTKMKESLEEGSQIRRECMRRHLYMVNFLPIRILKKEI